MINVVNDTTGFVIMTQWSLWLMLHCRFTMTHTSIMWSISPQYLCNLRMWSLKIYSRMVLKHTLKLWTPPRIWKPYLGITIYKHRSNPHRIRSRDLLNSSHTLYACRHRVRMVFYWEIDSLSTIMLMIARNRWYRCQGRDANTNSRH